MQIFNYLNFNKSYIIFLYIINYFYIIIYYNNLLFIYKLMNIFILLKYLQYLIFDESISFY